MLIETTVQDDEITIVFPSELNYKLRRQFREIYENHSRGYRYVVDFRSVSMIDSSTIGMLLLLREYVGGEKANVTLTNCQSIVRELLIAAHFEQLFRIV